jgi:hypothetical protein
MSRDPIVAVALAVVLGAGIASAQEPVAAPPPAVAPLPPPGSWVLVVPPGSNILVPGYLPQPVSRDMVRLRRVMEIEGPEFSQDKHDSYRAQKGGGIVLTVLGGASLYGSFMFFLADGSEWGAVGIVGGVLGIAIGIPLMVRGIRGKSRQALLKRKDEILKGSSWSMAVSAGPVRGGLTLGASVVF